MIVGIHHVAVGVDDLEKALAFYTEGLGFEVVQRSEFEKREEVDRAIGLKDACARMAMLKGPNAYLEVWEYSHPAPRDLRSDPNDRGYPHFALQVKDIQQEYDRLLQHGMTFAGDVVHFGEESSAIYGRDPFGNIIELYEINTPDIAQL
ncbi:MAG: VOC family protein [Proteobacteria bacterium]|nr:VOC family protein [Pseudomonadota bacterium]